MSDSGIKADARKLIYDDALKTLLISALFVFIFSALFEFLFLISGISDIYTGYMERVLSGDPHSSAMLLSFFSPVRILLAVFILLLIGLVRVLYMSYCLDSSRIYREDSKRSKISIPLLGKILLIMIIKTALTILWSMLFFFPGVTAHYRYRLAYYILLDDPEKSALQCIRESKTLMRGNKLELFLVDLSFLGWYSLTAVLTLILLFLVPFPLPFTAVWLLPYAGLTRAACYDHLLGNATA